MEHTDNNLIDTHSIQNVAKILSNMANEIDNNEVTQISNKVENKTTENILSIENMNKLINDSIDFMTRVIHESKTTKGLISSAYQQQSELVTNISNVMLAGAKEYIENFKDIAKITSELVKQKALIGTSTIYDKVLKAIELKERASSYVGQTKSIDELIKQHESVIYINMQKISLTLSNDDNYLSSELSDEDINEIVNKIVDTKNSMMNEINAHVIRAAQLFFFEKMGKSVVDNFGVISTTIEDEGDKQKLNETINNTNIIGQYKLTELRKRIVSIVENKDELKSFLKTLVNDIHNNDYHNHSKYFGMTHNVSSFIDDIIGPNGFLSIDINYRLNSVEKSIEYYIDNILGKKIKNDGSVSTGDSIRSPNGQLYKRVANLEESIGENLNDITDYVNQQYAHGFKDFGDEGDKSEKTKNMNNLTQAIEKRKNELNTHVQQIYQTMVNAINKHDNNTKSDEERDKGKRKRDDSEENDMDKRRKTEENSSRIGGKKTRKHKRTSKSNRKTKKNKKTKKKNGKMTRKKIHKSKKSIKKSRRSKRK